MLVRPEEELLEEEEMEQMPEEIEEKGDGQMKYEQDDLRDVEGIQEIEMKEVGSIETKITPPRSPLMAFFPKGSRKFRSPTVVST